jgi:organic radical activating enzyme
MIKIINWFKPNKEITKIYRDTSQPSYFMVDWMLHDRCTYDCSYCPPGNKSGTDSWLNLHTLDKFCDSLENHVRQIDPNFKIKVLFTGGEPTVWKDFGVLVNRLSDRGWSLLVNSNGSRTDRWWKEYAEKFSTIILSYHSEFVNDDEFIKKLKICEESTKTTVNLMLNPDPEFFKKSLTASERIKKETKFISVTHYKIQHTFGLQEIKVPHYTEEQEKIIESITDYHPSLPNYYKILSDNYYTKLSNGSVQKLDAVDLLNNKLVNFKDWRCQVGLESVFIDSKGDLLRGACRVESSFGNISSPENIQWPINPVTCPYNWCGCITDIKNSKEK